MPYFCLWVVHTSLGPVLILKLYAASGVSGGHMLWRAATAAAALYLIRILAWTALNPDERSGSLPPTYPTPCQS